MSHKAPRFIDPAMADWLRMQEQKPVPKKTRKKKDPCPHLQWWESSTETGKRYRRCVSCPRIEQHVNGDWKRCYIPKTINPKPHAHAEEE